MHSIDETRLETDLEYRFQYLAEFIGFGEGDVLLVHQSAEWLRTRLPAIVDAVYDKLHAYDCTWRHFLPRQSGSQADVPGSIDDLPMDHPHLAMRKQHLARYLDHLFSAPYDGRMAAYLHAVGTVHTSQAGNPHISIPHVQMNALLGFVADAINAEVLAAELPRARKAATLRAFGKLMWLQNDLITRHYAA